MDTNLITRLWRFPRKPWTEQKRSILYRVWRRIPAAVFPIRLPFGAWWLGQYEYSTTSILTSGYEAAETAFVQRFLRNGMTFVDVGANRGYYALLASQRVGRDGCVIAFEPSARERRFLRINLLLNFCRNVRLEPVALGAAAGEADLYIVDGYSTGCNSLRSRSAEFRGHATRVAIRTLDEYFGTNRIAGADLLKLDIEGGEFGVIKGAQQLLTRPPRPVILCEIIDQLTRLWECQPREIVDYLEALGFEWFGLTPSGALWKVPAGKTSFDGNFVAVPKEQLTSLSEDWFCRPPASETQ